MLVFDKTIIVLRLKDFLIIVDRSNDARCVR